MCQTEFKLSMFADGELPEAEARSVAVHLKGCSGCRTRVESLQAESRMLVQCLQDVDLAEETVPDFQAAPEPISLVRFAAAIIGVAMAFRVSTGILLGFELPPGAEWLSPTEWILNIGTAVNAAFYAIQNGSVAISNAIQTAAVASLGALILAGMARLWRRYAAVGAVLSVMLTMALVSPSTYAIDIRKGPAASLPAGEVVDDTLVVNSGGPGGQANKNINVAGTVKGDLVAAGDVVTVSGTVEGDVLAFARRVEITGTVGGTVIAAATSVTVSGQVGGSVIAAASVLALSGDVARNFIGAAANIELLKGSRVGGNIGVGAGDVQVESEIQKDVFASAGTMSLRGSARNVTVNGGQVTLTSSSRVGGDFTARVDKESNVRVDPAALIAGARNIRIKPARQSDYSRPGYYFWQIVRVITAFITGLVVFRLAPWLAPTRIASGVDWLKAGGFGFIALVSIPIAAVIVACTVVGLPIALASVVVWLAGLYLAKIMIAEFVGRTLMKNSSAVSLLAGIVLVIIAVDLPVLGGLINFLLCLLGLGAIVITVYRSTTRTPGFAET
jgi:anti-sigma factor RsiW/cytoskeletal protein CcmA (bactofilin family)